MKRRDEARQLYEQIINGTWAPALERYVEQAQQAIK
jgi:hypothetical protein